MISESPITGMPGWLRQAFLFLSPRFVGLFQHRASDHGQDGSNAILRGKVRFLFAGAGGGARRGEEFWFGFWLMDSPLNPTAPIQLTVCRNADPSEADPTADRVSMSRKRRHLAFLSGALVFQKLDQAR